MRKKTLVLLIVLALLIATLTTIAATPLKIGDVIGKVYYTDIKTYIDGKPIESVNIGGRTMISAEDLQYMGYYVYWDAQERKLDITSNASHNISGKVIIPDGKVAPKGGLKVYITAYINPNPFSPDRIEPGAGPLIAKQIVVVIPQGKSSAEYIVSVPKNPQGYKPIYVMSYRYEYYIGNFKCEKGDYLYKGFDMSTGDMTGVDYTFDNIDL